MILNGTKGNYATEGLLTPQNCAVIFIDHQPQMVFGVLSIDRQTLVNNVVGLARAAKTFEVPTVLTTVAAQEFSGPIIPQLGEVFPDHTPIDRSTVNAWEDEKFIAAVKATGRKKLVMAGLWTEVCLAFPVLCALAEGYEVYAVADASGGVSAEVHQMAMQRMIQAGATPVTWMQVMLEFQRDWARKATYDAVLDIIKDHGGAYGQGAVYVESMLPAHAAGG